MNADEKLPEDVSAEGNHKVVADLLSRARVVGEGSLVCDAMRHADGLGTLQEHPHGVIFTGIQEAESLRNAVNMAAGRAITPPIPVSRAATEGGGAAAMRAVDVVRGSL